MYPEEGIKAIQIRQRLTLLKIGMKEKMLPNIPPPELCSQPAVASSGGNAPLRGMGFQIRINLGRYLITS